MKRWLLPTLCLGLFGLSLVLQNYVKEATTKQVKNQRFIYPPPSIKYFTLGYSDFMASSLWLRLSQDFLYCEKGRLSSEDITPTSSEQKDKVVAILQRKLKPSKCHKGWVYQMLKAITTLQPKFEVAYTVGATLLSVITDDREGARLLFEKGLDQFPTNWELNFRAGYHYLWEIQNPQRAAELLKRAVENGAPQWVAALSANLYSKLGQAHLAKMIILDALEKKPDVVSQERLQYRLKQVNEIIKKNKNP